MKRLRVLILLSFGHLVSHWYIGVLMLVTPLIKQDFSLSFTEVGLLITIRSLAGAMGNTTSGVIVISGFQSYVMGTFWVAEVLLSRSSWSVERRASCPSLTRK